MAALGNLLKAIASKIPWYKVGQFFTWVANFLSYVSRYAYKYLSKITSFVSNNPWKIANWFLNGWSAWDVIKAILAYFGIHI